MTLEDVPEMQSIALLPNAPSLLNLGSLSPKETALTRLPRTEPSLGSTGRPDLFTVTRRLKSMVNILTGDLFESKAQTLVNAVNCVGVMGKGVALEFKKRFPEMFADYEQRCRRHEVRLGQPYLCKRRSPPLILNFPTKDHWRATSNLEDIIAGLEHLLAHYESWGIQSLAVPALGCGHGQLDWRVVGPTLARAFSRLGIPVELYAPLGTPQTDLQPL